jgi:hypothetical protein
MLRFVIYVIALAGLAACQQTKKDTTATPVTDSLAASNINDVLLNSNYDATQLQGIYTGQFDGSPISIAINYVSGKNVSGYNVHKGLKRNIRGNLEPMGRQFKLTMDEPGDNQYDGHFELFIDTASYTGQGNWTPKNDATLKKKSFTLVKKKSEDYNELAKIWADTLSRSIQLKEDGAATFSYYVNKGTSQEQLETINGNWQQKKDSVLIFWQPNTVLTSRRSSFFINRVHSDGGDTTMYIDNLRGENADWYNEVP